MRWFPHSVPAAWPLIALLSSAWLVGEPLYAQPQTLEQPPADHLPDPTSGESVVPITAYRTQIELTEKFSKVFETKANIKRVSSFDPTIVDVTALTPTRISVRGLIQGVTSLVITDDARTSYTVEVLVKGDARQLQSIIDRKFPNSSIEAFKLQDSVALRGWVTHPEHITQIVEIAEAFYPKVLNQMRVGGVQQVLLKVKVMEAQRSLIRQLGINFTYVSPGGYVTSNPGAVSSTAVGGALGGATLTPGRTPNVTTAANTLLTNASFGVVKDQSTFQSFISSLREEALVKILAEPEIVATNGQPATLLSGGEFPIVVPQSLGTVSIQYREFGVRMEAVALVLGNSNLRLTLQPEVSDRDDAHGVTINGTTVPALTVRRVNTQVEMKFGQTLMLAGLISNTQRTSMRKIPFLGELPYVGAAFSQKQTTEAETEIVITVTPELVAPLDPGQVPPGGPGQSTETPTDREFMLYGLAEVPKYGDHCPTCAPGQTGPYIVPGLKDSLSPPAAPTTERKELVTPPAPGDAETSAKARRFAAQMAARQKPLTSNSGVRQTAYDEAAVKARASESTRTSAPATSSRSAATAKSAAPIRSNNNTAASNNRDSQLNYTMRNKSDSNTARSRKPGLIEPPAR
jgi:pilus assembly protein CpaC